MVGAAVAPLDEGETVDVTSVFDGVASTVVVESGDDGDGATMIPLDAVEKADVEALSALETEAATAVEKVEMRLTASEEADPSAEDADTEAAESCELAAERAEETEA